MSDDRFSFLYLLNCIAAFSVVDYLDDHGYSWLIWGPMCFVFAIVLLITLDNRLKRNRKSE